MTPEAALPLGGVTQQLLLESAPDAVVIVDVGGLIRFANAQCEALFGYTRAQLIGQRVEMLVPERVRSIHPQHRARYMHSPSTRPMGAGLELWALKKNGREFPVDISLSSLETDEGLYVSVFIRDMSDRREAKAEAKFRGLLEAAPDAIVGVDRQGTIQLVNAQAENLFDYERAELMGKAIEILVPEAIREVHPTHRTNYFNQPSSRPMGAGLQLAARRKDGTEFPVDISLSTLDTEEGAIVLAAVRDISDRIREAQERERDELRARQSRMESIGQLAGGVAHDFNNLLAGIMSYAKLVEGQVKALNENLPAPNVVVLQDVQQITRAAERAAALTHQLLLFGRKEIVKPKTIDLNEVVSGMQGLLRRTIGEHIDLRARLEEGLAFIFMDPGHVEQILMNLAVNARDAMSVGGTLSIATSLTTLDVEYASQHGIAGDDYITLTVSDSGTGMSADIAARVFEPYFSTKPRGEGSGLGLATVYGIVTQAGGHISIYSEPELGTTVRVYFPISHELEHHSEDKEQARSTETRAGTILLVEDEELVREPTARFLRQMGFEVLVAADPEEALGLAADQAQQIHLLLTDVVMPGMSGNALAGTLKESRPDLKVLFMSGYSQDHIASQGVLDPDVLLVEKPFSFDGLLRQVTNVFEGG